MIDTIASAVTLALAFSGAFLALRHRLWSLAAMLACVALSEGTELFLNGNVYGYAWWSAQILQYCFLCFIACQAMARMSAHHGPIASYVCAVLGIVGAVAGWACAQGETLFDRYLDAEIAGSIALVGTLAVAYLFRKKFLEAPWTWITLGVVVATGGNILCAALWKVWEGAPQVYCIPAIVSLVIWNWAGAVEEEKARKFRELARV